MKRILITGTTMLALSFPAGALAEDAPAPSPAKNASKTCSALRAGIGVAAFKEAYGTNKNKSNAFGKCVSKQTTTEEKAVKAAKNSCKTEQDDANFAAGHDGKTFAQFYGTNKNGKNAYGKCVSGKAKAKHAEETATLVKAGKTCKTERKALGKEAFTAKYGGKSNAFGKCISAEAKADKAARS
jgi:hypothetical protein